MSVGPAIQEGSPARPIRHDVEADVGDTRVAFGVKPMGRRVSESKVLGEVQLPDERLGALQDDSEADGDIDDLKVLATVVAQTGSLEQLELLT